MQGKQCGSTARQRTRLCAGLCGSSCTTSHNVCCARALMEPFLESVLLFDIDVLSVAAALRGVCLVRNRSHSATVPEFRVRYCIVFLSSYVSFLRQRRFLKTPSRQLRSAAPQRSSGQLQADLQVLMHLQCVSFSSIYSSQ